MDVGGKGIPDRGTDPEARSGRQACWRAGQATSMDKESSEGVTGERGSGTNGPVSRGINFGFCSVSNKTLEGFK